MDLTRSSTCMSRSYIALQRTVLVSKLPCRSASSQHLHHKQLHLSSVAMASSTNGASGPAKPITLYDMAPEPGICPFVQRSKIVLVEKKLPFTTVYIEGANKDPKFVQLFRDITANTNHRATVPVIEDGDVRLAESHVVSQYLDDQYADHGPKLFPTDPYKRALVNLFVDNYSNYVQPPGFKIQASETLQENEDAVKAFVEGLKIIDAFLKTYGDKSGDFLLGKDFSYAEASTLPFLFRAHHLLREFRNIEVNLLIEENGLTHFKKWQEAGFARESLKQTLPPSEIYVEKGKSRIKVALKDLK